MEIKEKSITTYYVEFPDDERQEEDEKMKNPTVKVLLANEIISRLHLKRARVEAYNHRLALSDQATEDDLELTETNCNSSNKKLRCEEDNKNKNLHITNMAEEVGLIKPRQTP